MTSGLDAMKADHRRRTRVSPKLKQLASAYGVPVGLLLVAAGALAEGLRMVLTASAERPSGPPGWYLCAVAVLLALTTIAGTVRGRGLGAAQRPGVDDSATDSSAAPTTAAADAETPPGGPTGLARVWRALGLMAIYAYALPWLGFGVTNGIFTVAYLRWVAGYSVLKSIAYGLAIDIAAVVLFEQAGVLLPSGVIDLAPF